MNSCYRHPDREANIACQRCERPICPECMRDAAVGFQCPECVVQGQKAVRQPKRVSTTSISIGIIAVNVAVWLLTGLAGGDDSAIFENGAMLTHTAVNQQGELLRGFLDGAWWRPLTSAFLHSGILHLAFNMWAIYVFGPMLETVLGRARFLVLYGLTILGAGIAMLYFSAPNALTVGASGAVYGLFGAALVVLVRARQNVQTLLVLLAINIVISFSGGISWQAHFGGLIVGGLLGAYFAYTNQRWRQLDRYVLSAVAGLLAVVLYAPLILI